MTISLCLYRDMSVPPNPVPLLVFRLCMHWWVEERCMCTLGPVIGEEDLELLTDDEIVIVPADGN